MTGYFAPAASCSPTDKTAFRKIGSFAALVTILVAGLLFAWAKMSINDRSLRENLMVQARMAANSIDLDHLRVLTGTRTDLNHPAYLRLKNQLGRIKDAHDSCEFIYLMGMQEDGRVFFFVDNEPVGSENESPAGQIYDEISDEDLKVFKTLSEVVVGPVPDRWGVWVTALVPIVDPKTNELLAVFGLDVDARTWRWQVVSAAALPIGLMLALLSLLVLSGSQFKLRQIAEEHQADLYEISERLAATLKSIGDGVITCDKQGQIEILNSSAEYMTGWSNEEAKGKENHEVFRIVHAITREPAENPVNQALRKGTVSDLPENTILVSLDGPEYEIASSCAPIFDRSGQVIGAVLVFRSVTEENHSMTSLGKLVAGIAHDVNTPLSVIRASSENMISTFNDAVTNFDLICGLLSQEQHAAFFWLLSNGNSGLDVQSAREERRHKRELSERLQKSGIQDSETMASRLVQMGIYTDYKPCLPLLKGPRSLELLTLAYNLSSQRRCAGTILSASEQASRTVVALKNYTQRDKSGIRTLVSPQEGIETVLTLYHNQMKNAVELEVSGLDEIPPIPCYPDELNQVWTNLIHNALQAMNSKGRLGITGEQTESDVIITISDTGAGIPKDKIDRVFDSYFTTKPKGKGTGLGLHICRKIVQNHGGTITVESEPGNTTFRVSLPKQSSTIG